MLYAYTENMDIYCFNSFNYIMDERKRTERMFVFLMITFLNINLFMSNPDAIEDDIYEDILNLLEKGEKSGLKHKY